MRETAELPEAMMPNPEDADLAVSRNAAQAWFFAHDLFRTPDQRQWDWLRAGATLEIVSGLTGALGLSPWNESDFPSSLPEYESEFIAAFDAGAPTPLIPLLESHYNKRDPVPRIIHENILFYRSFGLSLKDSSAETADHLRFQLEFTGYLHEFEQEKRLSGDGAASCDQIQAGRRDFVNRHLLTWLPRGLETAKDSPFPWAHRYLELCLAMARAWA